MEGNHDYAALQKGKKECANEIAPFVFDSPCNCRVLVTPFANW
jgi:hypothetical protein